MNNVCPLRAGGVELFLVAIENILSWLLRIGFEFRLGVDSLFVPVNDRRPTLRNNQGCPGLSGLPVYHPG
jgi:hypothetical protein